MTFWGSLPDDATVQATATVSTAAGATDVVLGATIANLVLHGGMNNFKITLPSGFLPAASFLRVRWENLAANSYTSADFFVNQAGQCPTQKDLQPLAIVLENSADGFDSALTLAAGAVVNFGINVWGDTSEKQVNVTLETRTCDSTYTLHPEP